MLVTKLLILKAMALAMPTVTIPIQQIQLTPGSAINIAGVDWEQFEAILEVLGEQRNTRIVYSKEILEIMSPLPAHERPHRIIGYLVTTLLNAQGREWEDFGSTTFKHPEKRVGLEPDTCFYIQNAPQVRGCMETVNLAVYPPPDLAIEADVTSQTTLEAYEKIGVPEVWIYHDGTLSIYVLRGEVYVPSTSSPTFPNLPIQELIPDLVKQALEQGTSQVLRVLRQQFA
jgi:Uma2 family endonuclease